MNDILKIIRFCANLVTNTYLNFGNFRFSLLSIMVSLAAISLVSWFLHKMFAD